MPFGESYRGDFANDQFEGQGTYHYTSGAKYVGQWENNLSSGKVML